MSLAEILTRKKRSSTFLNSCCLGKNVWWVTTNFQARREGGCDGCARTPPPPSPTEGEGVHLIIDQQLKTKWSIVEYCSILIYWLCTKIENAVKKGHKPDSPFPQNVFSPS